MYTRSRTVKRTRNFFSLLPARLIGIRDYKTLFACQDLSIGIEPVIARASTSCGRCAKFRNRAIAIFFSFVYQADRTGNNLRQTIEYPLHASHVVDPSALAVRTTECKTFRLIPDLLMDQLS